MTRVAIGILYYYYQNVTRALEKKVPWAAGLHNILPQNKVEKADTPDLMLSFQASADTFNDISSVQDSNTDTRHKAGTRSTSVAPRGFQASENRPTHSPLVETSSSHNTWTPSS